MSDPKSQPYLNANFDEAGGILIWDTREEALAWVNDQISDWSWLSQQNINAVNSSRHFILESHLTPARDALNQVINYHDNPTQTRSLLTSAKDYLERLYKGKNSFLLPNSALRKFIFELRDSGKETEASLITSYLLNQDLNNSPLNKLIPALFELELFNRGNKDRLKAESSTLKNLAGSMTTALAANKELQANQKIEFDKFNADILEQANKRESEFDSSQAKREEQWSSQVEKSKEELKNIAAAYEVHMQLAAPVTYWETKRTKHKNFAICSFIGLVICMLLFGAELVAQVSGKDSYLGISSISAQNVVFNNKNIETTKTTNSSISSNLMPNTQQAPSTIDYLIQSKIWAYILLVTLAFWFIRLLVRLFLSNMHLENDAAERVTMAKTYQALIRDGSFERKDNIGTILAALFRPTGDGIVKDEGLPPTAMEWLTKLSGKN